MSPAASMPAMAQISSLSAVSPEMPTAPMTSPSASRISTPAGIADHAAAAHRRQHGEELRRVGRALGERARAEAHAERAPGFAEGDVEAQDSRLVLALEGDEMPAGIEHRDRERLEFLVAAGLEGDVDDG